MEEWQEWFLGENVKDGLWPANRFKRDVLRVAANELSKKPNLIVVIDAQKRGRKISGYNITVQDNWTNPIRKKPIS